MIYAFILAGGSGKRTNLSCPKTILKIKNKCVYDWAVELFKANKKINKIVVALPNKKNIIKQNIYFVLGGKTRNKSFQNCLNFSIKNFNLKNDDIILVHDGARILTNKKDIDKLLCLAQTKQYGSLAYKTTDATIYFKNNKSKYLDKKHLYCLTTPQFVKYSLLKKSKINHDGIDLLSYLNIGPSINNLVLSEYNNLKITYCDDFNIVKKII